MTAKKKTTPKTAGTLTSSTTSTNGSNIENIMSGTETIQKVVEEPETQIILECPQCNFKTRDLKHGLRKEIKNGDRIVQHAITKPTCTRCRGVELRPWDYQKLIDAKK